MIDIDGLRRSLDTFADQARPADLGQAALTGARRRRRRRRISVTVVLLLLAGFLVPMTVLNLRHDASPPLGDLPAGSMGPHLVTAYAAGQKWYVIDPVKGRYRQVDGGSVTSVSPNLRLYTDLASLNGSSTVLRITSTSQGGPNTFLTIDGDAVGPVWSPDGNWLALPVFVVATDAIKAEYGFTEIVFVDVLNGKMHRQKIELGGRYGSWVQWADDGTLLVATEHQRYKSDGVAVVRRDGKMLSWHPLPAGDYCDAPAILPIHDSKLLTCTNDGSQQVYRVFDPRLGTLGPELGRISLPPDLRARAVWWDGDDRPVLEVRDLTNDVGEQEVQVARLSTGKLEASPKGLPDATLQLLVGSSDGLSLTGRKFTF